MATRIETTAARSDKDEAKKSHNGPNGVLSKGGRASVNGSGCHHTAHDPVRNRSRVRVYVDRQSYLVDLVAKNKNIRGLLLLFSTQVAIFVLYFILKDSYQSQRVRINLSGFFTRLGLPYNVIRFALLESVLLICTLLIHPIFKLWVSFRGSVYSSVADGIFALIYGVAVVMSVVYTVYFCDSLEIPVYLRVALSIENVRVCMKSYSFIRENAYKVLYPWHKDDDSGPAVWYAGQMSPTVASFSQYCYYLFSPALLYRDHYPRSKGPIHWKKALGYLTVFVFVPLCIAYFIAHGCVMPSDLSYGSVLQCFINGAAAGLPSLLIGHMVCLEGWQGFMAELTRFADRQLYSDWWNSTDFGEWYRKWNLLVHEYIHQYLYLDLKRFVPYRDIRLFLALAVSALAHEYFISMAVGFFTPILFVNFAIIGFIFILWPMKHPLAKNWATMFFLCIGEGLMLSLYMIELLSQRLCSEDNTPTYVGLKMFHCIAKNNN